ncbi:MAG: hypothetical protein IPN83_26935 [Holophagales bacterium]|nr:hypothetical protein [Holophagales bacterium]
MAGTRQRVTATVNRCTSPAGTTSVTVNPIPSTPTAGNSGAVCEGGTISLTASTVPGATYAWTGPNGFTSAAQNPTIPSATVAMAGTYSVTTTVNGCTSPASTTNVTVNPIPSTPTAGNAGAVCEGGTITLTASTVPGATYAWTGPNGFTSAAQNPTIPSATVAMAGTYSVTATVNGCTSPAGTTSVTVNPIPSTPTAGNGGAVCEGGMISLTASTIPGATYAWTGPNGFTSSAQNPTIPSATIAMAGTYSVTATVNGCASADATTAVVIDASPVTPVITAPPSVWPQQSFTVSVPEVAGVTYDWVVTNGTITAGSGTRSITITAGTTGSVGVSVTETNEVTGVHLEEAACRCRSASSRPALHTQPLPALRHAGRVVQPQRHRPWGQETWVLAIRDPLRHPDVDGPLSLREPDGDVCRGRRGDRPRPRRSAGHGGPKQHCLSGGTDPRQQRHPGAFWSGDGTIKDSQQLDRLRIHFILDERVLPVGRGEGTGRSPVPSPTVPGIGIGGARREQDWPPGREVV